MTRNPESRLLSIVLVGRFNPVIFTPAWLASKGIISIEQSEEAKTEIIHPEISKFSVGDFNYDITSDRFNVQTQHSHLVEKMQEDVIKIFSSLSETPVIHLGLNWHSIYKYSENESDKYINFGHKHIPKKDFWDKNLKNSGVQTLEIRSDRNDKYSGYIKSVIREYKPEKNSIEIYINDHYDLIANKEENEVVNAKKGVDILTENFSNSRDFCTNLIMEIFKYGNE